MQTTNRVVALGLCKAPATPFLLHSFDDMPITDDWPILREGVWLYAGSVRVAVRILLSTETWGTGDHEDEESIRENRSVQCYFLAYEMAAAPGNFCNLMPNIMSFEEAVSVAEQRFPGIQWASSTRQ